MNIAKRRLAIWTAVSMPDKRKPTDPDVKDKFSLKEQERLGLAFGDEGDYDIVKVFRWPGHSRDESDIIQALEDFANDGRYEYHELREMWRTKAFDDLWCHSHSRLGRSFTLQSWVIENIIRSGARIYRHVGGWISREDYGGQIALGGFAGISERERRITENNAGMTARALKGLNLSKVPFPHHLIRDPVDGKAIRMEIDPANRLFLDHMYQLMMEGVSLTLLGAALFERYGHANPRTGEAWSPSMLYEMLHRPSFWGHTARKYRIHKRDLYQRGWGYDLSVPFPDGVEMHRHTHEPGYAGERASDVQSFIRHKKNIKGITRKFAVHSLSGLVYCPECGRQLHYARTKVGRNRYRIYLHCPRHYEYRRHNSEIDCKNTRHVRESLVQGFVDQVLQRALSGESHEQIFGRVDVASSNKTAEAVEADIKHHTKLIERLMRQAAEMGDDMTEDYKKLITDEKRKRSSLEHELQQMVQEREQRIRLAALQARALDELAQITPEDRWAVNHENTNRLLKDYFGRYCIFVLDGLVMGTDLRPHRRRHRV